MTQKEIFENMTRGEWHLSHSPAQAKHVKGIGMAGCYKSIKNKKGIGGVVLANTFGALNDSGIKNCEANAAAVVEGVNLWQSLMSKGINPEAVERCLSILAGIKIMLDNEIKINLRELSGQIETALTAAKL